MKQKMPIKEEKMPIKEVYFYDPFARGEIHEEVHEGSDIDLIIIGNFKERLFDRIGKVLDLTDLPIEPLVYTEEGFRQMIREGNPLFQK